ncbi:MAG TPA: acetoacetate--CoA ligase [Terriglobia bacterium]|nr:acetoacetate--CoA ligase [Terriglobia bacterium]
MQEPLWQPSEETRAHSNLARFIERVSTRTGVEFPDYWAFDRWTVDHPADFWTSVWDFGGVLGERTGPALENGTRMPGARWFPESRLNYAANLLRRRDDETAIVFWGEDKVRRRMTYRELYDAVSRLAQAFRASGVGVGARVAGFMPNVPETVVAMLATASVGAVWASCSPDFGASAVLDRFGQIQPKVLIGADGYFYNGKRRDSLAPLTEIQRGLPSVERTLVAPYANSEPDLSGLTNASTLDAFTANYTAREIAFERAPFSTPLFIMFSSGTTGPPKCIVHGAGGTLLQHLKEHLLHGDTKPGDRLFYFTTCGWMMWNWMVSALATEATLLLYDGSPFFPSPDILWRYAETERMTFFGTSAKYIETLAKRGAAPRQTRRLDALRAIFSTGSPLAPEDFDYVYTRIKPDVRLCSISGGTDIISCFVLGNPLLPVWRGEIQCRGLGMNVDVFDETGRPVRGEKGELVCTAPFPSMPVAFGNDPDGRRYHAAYFERFPNVWSHGDYAEITPHNGFIIHGRSDTTLNPGGVRIGTAEIYRQVEQLDEVLESVAVGQEWEHDTRIVLFVRLREGCALDDALVERIKSQIRRNTSPRHTPAKVVQVTDIPHTQNGKIAELAVRETVHGRPVKNLDALANPEALAEFRERAELKA